MLAYNVGLNNTDCCNGMCGTGMVFNSGRHFFFIIGRMEQFIKIRFYFANNIYGATFVTILCSTMEHKRNY